MKYNVYLSLYGEPYASLNRVVNTEAEAKDFCDSRNDNDNDIGFFYYVSEREDALETAKEWIETNELDDHFEITGLLDGFCIVSNNHAGDVACHSGTNWKWETYGTIKDYGGVTTHEDFIDAILALMKTPKNYIYVE